MRIAHKAFNLELKFSEKPTGKAADGTGVEHAEFEGYASTFGNLDSTNDIVQRGAFTKTLSEKAEFPLYWNHSSSHVMGRITEAREDEKGLWVKGRVNLDTSTGKDVYALLKGGDVSAMSIGYIVTEREWKDSIRIIKGADLVEISLVSNPANVMAQVSSIKCFDALRDAESLNSVERILRDGGFSEKESKALISKVKDLSASRDGSDEKTVEDLRDEDPQETKNIDGNPDVWKAVYDKLNHFGSNIND